MYELHLAGPWLNDGRDGIRPIRRAESIANRRQRIEQAPDASAGSSKVPTPVERSSRVERRRTPRTQIGLEDAALATLDNLNRGVVLLDKDGRVQFVNRAARVMLHRRDGLTVRQHRLTFSQSSAAAAFADWLVSAGGSLVLRAAGASGRWHDAYRVLISPFGPERSNRGYSVFIHEPHCGRRHLPIQVLRQLYGLSAAEARLANALFAGRSPQAAAEELCISLNTAKTQLKRIFAKCEVASRAELLQFLSLGPDTVSRTETHSAG